MRRNKDCIAHSPYKKLKKIQPRYLPTSLVCTVVVYDRVSERQDETSTGGSAN